MVRHCGTPEEEIPQLEELEQKAATSLVSSSSSTSSRSSVKRVQDFLREALGLQAVEPVPAVVDPSTEVAETLSDQISDLRASQIREQKSAEFQSAMAVIIDQVVDRGSKETTNLKRIKWFEKFLEEAQCVCLWDFASLDSSVLDWLSERKFIISDGEVLSLFIAVIDWLKESIRDIIGQCPSRLSETCQMTDEIVLQQLTTTVRNEVVVPSLESAIKDWLQEQKDQDPHNTVPPLLLIGDQIRDMLFSVPMKCTPLKGDSITPKVPPNLNQILARSVINSLHIWLESMSK